MTTPQVDIDDVFSSAPSGGEVVGADPLLDVESFAGSALNLLSGYASLFVIAFLVTLLTTPLFRRLAVRLNVIDHPNESRKVHRMPIAYLGGMSVFCGLLAAIAASYVLSESAIAGYRPVPFVVVIGIFAITFTGLADDIWGWDPRLKIAGQLVAAAALATQNVGVHVAEGLLMPILGKPEEVLLALGSVELMAGHIYYWLGTAIIACFVLGGCNAANLIDGLDGLLSGVVGIVAVGLLAICVLMAEPTTAEFVRREDTLIGARIVLCVALLGAVLGFLPHNFNPATIFLGDAGSLLLGYMCIVVILMLGEQGKTHLVFAGLIVFSLPIMDTMLAIFRRVLAGESLSTADDQHIHHQLRRTLGTVKRAVLSLYAISVVFALIGVALAALAMKTDLRVRVIYAIALVFYSWIAVVAVKEARRKQFLAATKRLEQTNGEPATATARPADVPAPAPEASNRFDRKNARVMSLPPTRILFVCMGNICRSPLAEGIFEQQVRARGVTDQFVIDSAGTGGWHAGERADARMRRTANAHGVELTSRARQVVSDDFSTFDVLICMDDDNRQNLLDAGAPPSKLHLLLDFDPDASHREVPDPYYGGADGFELVYRLVEGRARDCSITWSSNGPKPRPVTRVQPFWGVELGKAAIRRELYGP